jgi:hypothetical protein
MLASTASSLTNLKRGNDTPELLAVAGSEFSELLNGIAPFSGATALIDHGTRLATTVYLLGVLSELSGEGPADRLEATVKDFQAWAYRQVSELGDGL